MNYPNFSILHRTALKNAQKLLPLEFMLKHLHKARQQVYTHAEDTIMLMRSFELSFEEISNSSTLFTMFRQAFHTGAENRIVDFTRKQHESYVIETYPEEVKVDKVNKLTSIFH